jgi:hypothetical protein
MNSSEPRLNKLPFILTDAACLAAVALIGLFAKDPFAPLPLILGVSLVVIGGVVLLIPFLVDYAADSREASARLRDELELQIKRVQAAGESLGRAAAQIKAVEEAVQKSAHEAETLPYRMQEKLAEFNEALAEKESEGREALERELDELRSTNSDKLRAVAEKIQKATADWTALETATRRQLSTVQEAAGKLDELLNHSLAKIDAKIAALEKAVASVPSSVALAQPADATAARTEEHHEQPESAGSHGPPLQSGAAAPAHAAPEGPAPHEASPAPEPAAAAEETPKPRKPRPPRRPKPEDTLAAMSDPSPAPEPEGPAAEVSAQAPTLERVAEAAESAGNGVPPVESSTSSDGATRLLATAYIGIGNKLFIRGDGPGLSWDRGVPMQFVSIGKWGWFTHDATGPVRVKLYKNDETAALSGEFTLEPGKHTEVTALF